jgi:hypothetical protein
MPRSLTILNDTQSKYKINAKRLTSRLYFNVLNQGISSNTFKNLKILNLSDNNINNDDLQLMIQSWPISLVELDLSNNSLTKNCVPILI